MTYEIDLTEAVQAAAAAEYGRAVTAYQKNHPDYHPKPWADLPPIERHAYSEWITTLVHAAHQDIARQAFNQGLAAGMREANNVNSGIYHPPTRNPYTPKDPR